MFQVPQTFASQQAQPASIPPQNTMISTSPTGEQKPRKLRASCDACSRAKVKCDKVRPTCHRCGNMGICCNYSPSMRLGKPRKNRNPDGTILREVSPANNNHNLGPLPRPDMIPRTTSYTAESSPEPTDPFFFGPATPEFHFQDAYVPHGFEGSQSPFSESNSFFNSGWASSDEHMMFQPSPTDLYSPMASYPSSPFATHARTTSVHSQPEMFSPMEGLHSPPLQSPTTYFGMQDQQTLPLFAPEKMSTSPPASTTSLQHHGCTQFAFQTLNSLYPPPASQPSAGAFNGSSDGLPTLDSVVSTNKAAVDKLFVLLGCPCSSNPHFSTTIAFTIVKILSWYQAISGAHASEGEFSMNTQMDVFPATPISLADFSLECADEHTARTQLILTELRKVEKLIDKFAERYCKSSAAADLGIDGGVYGALESLLRTRVRDTFKVTMKTAPEEIKRQVASRTQHRMRTQTF